MEPTLLEPEYHIITLREALAPDQCETLIALAESRGFTDAPVTTPRGFVMNPSLRNNTRVILDDPDLAQELFTAIVPAVPSRLGAWTVAGLNERFRFYRYDPGQKFGWHRDGAFERHAGERSRLTLMFYLNGGFDGGETEFDTDPPRTVRPAQGLALLFEHHVRHQGAPVRAGRKYVLRTDVMYRRD